MRTVEVKVTAEHIAEGERFNPTCCPIALAIQGTIPVGKFFAGVGASWITWDAMEEIEIPLPKQAIDFRAAFDSGKPVSPFAFTIELPE